MPSWFLGVLFQLIIISPIFIVVYYKNQFYGIIALISVMFLSLFSSIAPKVLFDISPFQMVVSDISKFDQAFIWWHMTPNNYSTSYFVGIAFGYLFANNAQVSRSKSVLFWVSSIVFCTLTYFWNNWLWSFNPSTALFHAILWNSIGKLAFSIGAGWIYFACCTGRGGNLIVSCTLSF